MRPVAKTRLALHPFSSFEALHGGAFALVAFRSFAFSPWLILLTLGALLVPLSFSTFTFGDIVMTLSGIMCVSNIVRDAHWISTHQEPLIRSPMRLWT